MVGANDEPNDVFVGEVLERPLKKYHESVFESDQRHEVHEHPNVPCYPALEAYVAKLHNGFTAAYRGHTALVAVGKRHEILGKTCI